MDPIFKLLVVTNRPPNAVSAIRHTQVLGQKIAVKAGMVTARMDRLSQYKPTQFSYSFRIRSRRRASRWVGAPLLSLHRG